MPDRSLMVAIAAALLFAFSACAKNAVDADKVYKGSHASFAEMSEEWTRTGKLYHNFETEMVFSATYFSKPYRDALRGERARAEKLAADEIARLERADKEEDSRSVRFYVSAYTPVTAWNNFDKPKPSFRLWLVDAKGHRLAPSSIKEVKIKTRSEQLYRPATTDWSKGYDVYFPKKDESGVELTLSGGAVVLEAAGIQGDVKLKWLVH